MVHYFRVLTTDRQKFQTGIHALLYRVGTFVHFKSSSSADPLSTVQYLASTGAIISHK